jgi:hypothetical protein
MTTDYSVTKLNLSEKGLTELPKDIHLYKNIYIHINKYGKKNI